jgi:hypothetical protein
MRGANKLLTLFPARINGPNLSCPRVSQKAGEERATPRGPILADASFWASAVPYL